jgi:penicillin-binding protein 1B
VQLDKTTNLLATPNCPETYSAYFIDGTAPTATCDHPNGDTRNIFQKLLGLGENQKPPAPAPVSNSPQQNGSAPLAPGQMAGGQPPNPQAPPDQSKKKKGFWGKIFGGGDKSDKDKNRPPQQEQ